MEVLAGLMCGIAFLIATDGRRPIDRRARAMNDARAAGYRAALGENPATMRMRGDQDRRRSRAATNG